MFDSSWVSIFFRIANCAMLVAIGYYAYRKYLKAPLEEKVSQKEAVLKGLEEQGYFLEGRAGDLDDQRKMQERHTALLKQKVDDWHDAVISEYHKTLEENRIFAARAAERIKIKNEYVEHHELTMQIAPALLHDAKEVLQKQFADQSANARYVHDIVDALKRKQQS